MPRGTGGSRGLRRPDLGGLLISVSAKKKAALVKELKARGVTTVAVIGEVVEEPKGRQVVE